MDRIAGLEDLFRSRPANIGDVVDGSQPCNTGDSRRRDTFHPEKGNQSGIPRKDCLGEPGKNGEPGRPACPFRIPCAHYAVHHEPLGYWGGLTAKDRWTIRRELGIGMNPHHGSGFLAEELTEIKRRAYATRVSNGNEPRYDASHRLASDTEAAA
jgi:hypothetical protein